MKVSIKIIDVEVVFGRPMFLWTYNILGRGEILLKKKMNVEKNLECFEKKELYVILLNHSSSSEQKHFEEARNHSKLYELYKNLNPKYSEEIILLNEAKLKIDSSDIVNSSKYNIFSNY